MNNTTIKKQIKELQKINKGEEEKIAQEENKIDFEDYLQDQFFDEEPQTLDDEFPDKFNDWLGGKDVNEILEYVENWTKEKIIKALQQTRAEYREIIIEWEKEVGGLYDKDGQFVNLTYLFGKLNNIKQYEKQTKFENT